MVIDTTADFHAGYIAATLIYLAYGASLWSRARKAREKLAASTRSPAAASAPSDAPAPPGAR